MKKVFFKMNSIHVIVSLYRSNVLLLQCLADVLRLQSPARPARSHLHDYVQARPAKVDYHDAAIFRKNVQGYYRLYRKVFFF